jgi:hypothetical protein
MNLSSHSVAFFDDFRERGHPQNPVLGLVVKELSIFIAREMRV